MSNSDGSIRISIEVDGKQVSLAAKELDNLEAAAMRSGKGAKNATDGINDLGSSGAKAGKDLSSASGAVSGLADASTSASKNVAGASSNLSDLGSISSSTSKNLSDANLVIGDIAGGSTAASGSIKNTTDTLADLGSISSTAGSNLQNTNLVLGDIAGGSTTASANIAGAADSLNNMGGSADNAADANRRAAQETENVGNASGKASMGIKEIAVSLGLVAVASAALSVLKSSLDAAISRFDTLNTFPKVLEALGVSAEDSQRAMAKLSDGIDGLPTILNDIAANAQRMYTSFNDMDEATDTAIALNNAMLGSGSSAADAQRGTEQYLQVLQKGKFEMQEWKTLQETMDVGLLKVAESLGFVGKTAKSDLYEALKYGSVSLEEFNNKLIEVGTGSGIMAQLARENSLGLATSIGNLKNAAARGIANIIDSFNKLTKEVTGKEIAENIDSLKMIVNSSFKVIGSVIEGTAPTVIFFTSTAQAAIPVVKALSPAIIGLMTAYAAYTVISKASAAIEASNAVLKVAQASKTGLTLVTKAHTAALAADLSMTKAQTVATIAQTGAVNLNHLAIGVLTGKIGFLTAAKTIATAAANVLRVAWQAMLGPVGWVTAAIGLLVAGTITLVKWLNKSTEEGERLNSQNEKLASSTNALNSAVEDSSKAYEKNQAKIETNAEAYAELAAKAEQLAAKEKLTGEEKKTLNSYIEELNRNVSGLNLVYGEQSHALSATSEQILNRINLMKEEELLQASQERLTEIMKEQIDLGKQFQEVNNLKEEWNQKLDEGSVKSKEHKAALKELEEQETSLTEAYKVSAEERIATEQQIIDSSAAVAAATEEDVGRQLLMFDELSEGQQKTVESMKETWDDYASAATDMFDKLSDKSKLSVSEMQKNLDENQRVITTWSENIAKLAERGVDEGLLNTLREAGPESAGHVNALVKASDKELEKLSESFRKGGAVATEALSKSLGIKDSGLLDAVGHLVINTEQALAEGIKNGGFEELGASIVEGQAKGIKDGTPEAEKAATEMAKATEDAAREQLKVNSPSKVFEEIGGGVPEGMVLGINNGMQAVLDTVNTLAKNAIKPFQSLPTDFEDVGEETMAGFNRGLKAGEKQVMATVQSIANNAASTMRKALDIHSPSREFEDIGEDTGMGMVVGLEGTKEANRQAILGVAKVLSAAARDNAAEIVKITKQAENDRNEVQQNAAKQRAEIERKSAQSIESILMTSKNKKGQITASGSQRILNTRRDTAVKLEKLEADSAEKIVKINEKAAVDITKKESQLYAERLVALKNYVADKKSVDELSLVAESEVWRKSLALFKDGTKEKIEVQKGYQAALKAINDAIVKANEDYAGKMINISDKLANETTQINDELAKKITSINDKVNNDILKAKEELVSKSKAINDKLIADQQRVNEEYAKAYDDHYNKMLNFAGLFDEFDATPKVSADQLLENLQSQVDGFKNWEEEIDKLSSKAIDEGLIAELKAMGPKALPQLLELNKMTDEQLNEYSSLYREKAALARENTDREMAAMKEDTQRRLEELRAVANAELAQLNADTYARINEMRRIADAEISQLKADAEKRITEMRQAANEQLDALKIEWTEKIAEITKTTDDELKSLKQIGINAGQGLLNGLASMEGPLVAKARSIAESIKAVMASALDIHSPSRWMRDYLVGNMVLGFIKGVDKNESKVLSAASRFGEMLKPDLQKVSIPQLNFRPFNPSFSDGSGGSPISTDNRKTFAPKIVNHFTPAESTPSEHARKQDQLLKRLGMEF